MKDLVVMSSTCIQGGYPRSIMGFQNSNQPIGPHSPPEAWQYPPVLHNPSEDKNDSGINSASDCNSSSPGSENGVGSSYSPTSQSTSTIPVYPPPSYPMVPTATAYQRTSLTFPSEPRISVKEEPEDIQDKEDDAPMTGFTPHSPDVPKSSDALKCLEMSVERSLSSTASPGISDNSMDSDRKPDTELEGYDDDGHRVPRLNSHGKMKVLKCKQCPYTTVTKYDFWTHQRVHIKPEKLLTCHKCPFVTEYKHHLEYHLRNHNGSKPFKCEHCEYTCVNKSMLNSHMKSHSSIYQYRCADCHYLSKYCHSLKLHLRKYGHKPAMVLNPDGSPNPLPIIDVYGTRRGPKVKPLHMDQEQPKSKKIKPEDQAAPLLPLPLQQLMTQAPPMQMPFAYSWLQQAMIYQNILARSGLSPRAEESNGNHQDSMTHTEVVDSSGALDLSKVSETKNDEHSFKMDTPSTSSDEDEEHSTTIFENVEVVQNDGASEDGEKAKPKSPSEQFTCQYCNINFGDAVLYTMHMGYHGYQDPFACNMCGEKCTDKVSFFLHIARTSHL